MGELTPKQLRVQNDMKSMLKTAPWLLRISEVKRYTGPVMEISERRTTEDGKTRLQSYGILHSGKLRACREPIRYMLSLVTDPAGRQLDLQELIGTKIAYRGSIPLDEVTGTKLALLFKLQGQVRNMERVEMMAWRIERFGREESMYWLSKVTVEPLYGRRSIEWARSGLRLMLAGQQKDIADVRRLLDDLRK